MARNDSLLLTLYFTKQLKVFFLFPNKIEVQHLFIIKWINDPIKLVETSSFEEWSQSNNIGPTFVFVICSLWRLAIFSNSTAVYRMINAYRHVNTRDSTWIKNIVNINSCIEHFSNGLAHMPHSIPSEWKNNTNKAKYSTQWAKNRSLKVILKATRTFLWLNETFDV